MPKAVDIHVLRDMFLSVYYFGIVATWSHVRDITTIEKSVDHIYLRMTRFGGQTEQLESSPFAQNANQPEAIIDWIKTQIGPDPNVASMNSKSKLHLAWSVAGNENCMYPNTNGQCGNNFEFGTWNVESFNQFFDVLSFFTSSISFQLYPKRLVGNYSTVYRLLKAIM